MLLCVQKSKFLLTCLNHSYTPIMIFVNGGLDTIVSERWRKRIFISFIFNMRKLYSVTWMKFNEFPIHTIDGIEAVRFNSDYRRRGLVFYTSINDIHTYSFAHNDVRMNEMKIVTLVHRLFRF